MATIVDMQIIDGQQAPTMLLYFEAGQNDPKQSLPLNFDI